MDSYFAKGKIKSKKTLDILINKYSNFCEFNHKNVPPNIILKITEDNRKAESWVCQTLYPLRKHVPVF